jgi:hypothetical protein
VLAIADEDLERENETKTSSVHFLRFSCAGYRARLAWRGACYRCGSSRYTALVSPVPDATRQRWSRIWP